MSTKKPIWVKWYLSRWLSSMTRLRSDLATRGLYRDLLDFCYLEGAIPSGREDLIRLASCTAEEFDAAWPKVANKFKKVPGRPGWLTNDLVEDVLIESGYSVEQKESAGKTGAAVRWRKYKDSIAPAMAPVIAGVGQNQNQNQNIEKNNPCASASAEALADASSPEEKPAEDSKADWDERFEGWWDSYAWRKDGKKEARRAFEKAVRGLAKKNGQCYEEAFLELLRLTDAYLKRFSATDEWDRWRKNLLPATFFGGERWQDQGEDPSHNHQVSYGRVIRDTMDPETRRRLDERRKAGYNPEGEPATKFWTPPWKDDPDS